MKRLFFRRMASRVRHEGLRAVASLAVAAASLVEIPVFLVRNRRLFKNDFLYVFWHWSFGHTVSGIDAASRLFFPSRISLIYIPHPGSNPWVPRCFAHNVDVFPFRGFRCGSTGHENAVKAWLLNAVLLILSAWRQRLSVIRREQVYRALSAGSPLREGHEESGAVVPSIDLTGYCRMIREEIGRRPRPPSALTVHCQQAIELLHPGFFAKPFVTLGLREKGRGGAMSSRFRCAGPADNYVAAVRFLTGAGYHVVGACETPHETFRGIEGYFDLSDAAADPKSLNLFLLMKCALFIGQHSGPYILPNSVGVPVLLTDAVPHRMGTFRREDVVLYKRVRERATGRILSPVDIYRRIPSLALGCGFERNGVEVIPNTAAEILDAVRETVAIARGELVLAPEDALLAGIYRRLPTPDLFVAYESNRTSLSVLREHREDLLKYAAGAGLLSSQGAVGEAAGGPR